MPSYYNHRPASSKKAAAGRSGPFSPEEFFNEQDFQEEAREVQKIKVKYLKTTTNMTHLEIAEQIEDTVSKVGTLWKEIREEEAFELEELADAQIRKQLREYEFMKMELFAAWHESKEEFEKFKSESGTRADKIVEVDTVERYKKLPKVDYFSEIRQINSKIAELLGIVKLTEINFNQQNNNVQVIGKGPEMIPDSFDAFTKKPEQLPEGKFTSIEDADPEQVDAAEEGEFEEVDSID